MLRGVAVPKTPKSCVPLLKALADDTRWRIVRELLRNDRTVGDLGKVLKVSQYNVSKHLRILREAGIVDTERAGKHIHCQVAESFRKQLSTRRKLLDLGCCTFNFE